MRDLKDKNSYRSILAIVLTVYILSIGIMKINNEDRDFSESENRRLEIRPVIKLERVVDGRFTEEYESYISDQFPLRDQWIGVKSTAEKLLGKRENNGVYLGEDGYLMEKFSGIKEMELERKIGETEEMMESLGDMEKYFLLAPNANEILEEKLPKYAPNDSQVDYIKNIEKLLSKDINLVDITDNLKGEKDGYIYYKTDHHWTSKGAFIAYEKLMEEMGIESLSEDEFNIEEITDEFYGSLYSKSGFRNIDPDKMELYIPKIDIEYTVEYIQEERQERSIYNRERLEEKDKYKVFLDGNHPLIEINTNIENEKKILIIKDSYANSIIPFLINHFKEIHIIDQRYYTGEIDRYVRDKGINQILLLLNINSFLSK